MTGITRISIRDIRRFNGQREIELPRVTLVVGENSRDKSTFLSCCYALRQMAFSGEGGYYAFNGEAFPLGVFEDVVARDHKEFELGGIIGELNVLFRFKGSKNRQFHEQSGCVGTEKLGIMRFERHNQENLWKLDGPNFQFDLASGNLTDDQFSQWLGKSVLYQHLPYGGDRRNFEGTEQENFTQMCNFLRELSEAMNRSWIDVRAVSPGIGMPRFYYEKHPIFPYRTNVDDDNIRMLMRRVKQFGRDMTVFDDIRVSRLGKDFILEVQMGGEWLNITEVGFGVHCILPVLANLAEWPNSTILLQQPETHLHPVAETRLAQLLVESKGRYIVETHSDYILRRFQICARKNSIDPNDVRILWFEETHEGNRIHEIKINEDGDLIGAPPSYQKFFNEETYEYLGFK